MNNNTLAQSGIAQGGALQTLSTEQLFATYHHSVVQVRTDKKSGTGFFVSNGETIVTAAHVITGATRIDVIGSKGEKWTVRSVRKDDSSDLAVLTLQDMTTRKPIRLKRFSELSPGSRAIVISNPLGLTNSVSEGIISACRLDEGIELAQFTAAVSKGSSGGPVLDVHGQAIGVVSFAFSEGDSLYMAVAQPAIHRVLNRSQTDAETFFAEAARQDQEREKQEVEAEAARLAAERAKRDEETRLAKEKAELIDEARRKLSENESQEINLKKDLDRKQSDMIFYSQRATGYLNLYNKAKFNANSSYNDYSRAVDNYNDLRRTIDSLPPGTNDVTIGAYMVSLALAQKAVGDAEARHENFVAECARHERSYYDAIGSGNKARIEAEGLKTNLALLLVRKTEILAEIQRLGG